MKPKTFPNRKRPKGNAAVHCLILQAADTKPSPFYIEQLIVVCWEMWPELFAMEGYPEYPDANKVSAAIFHEDGPVRRGWIAPIGRRVYHERRQYRITVAGRRKIKDMLIALESPQGPPL